MLENAELHSAFVWDCEDCGRENFVRAIEGGIDEEQVSRADTDTVMQDLATDDSEIADGICQSPYLIARVSIAPQTVMCRHCNKEYRSKIWSIDDLDAGSE